MNLKQYVKRALSLPPHIVLIKVYQLLLFRFQAAFLQLKDGLFPTFSSSENAVFRAVFPVAPEPKEVRKLFPELSQLVENSMRHEFDLLASGWVKVKYNMVAKGILDAHYQSTIKAVPRPASKDWLKVHINRSNRQFSGKIWELLSERYEPIDWHIDFKSGYRWNPKTWWFKVPYGHKRGVDIKVPWELSRCQHFAWLALEYGKTRDLRLGREFQNQILDFIATNPPNYGVNWRCAMDVAIRASNWILAYEWFRLYGWEFDEKFQRIFAASLVDHGRYIHRNLEIGKDGFRGNHYLADVCGLAFISSFLPKTKEVDEWESFSFDALKKEMDYQFHAEGSNFEGSTSYHRLSGEMMLYTSIIFLIKENSCFPQEYLDRLYRMRKFSIDVTRPDGKILQVGDCDSGRFFKIQPLFLDFTLSENHLTHHCFIDAIHMLFSSNEVAKSVEAQWIKTLNLNLNSRSAPHANAESKQFSKDRQPLLERFLPNGKPLSTEAVSGLGLPFRVQSIPHDFKNKTLTCYPEFGVYIWKSDDSFLSFRCGPVGQKNRGGHDHNDQLSIEFYDRGRLVKYDPGTAIYTPFPEIRNKYRSVKSHSAPLVQDESGKLIEPGPLDQGLFSLNGKQGSELLVANLEILAGYNAKLKTIRIIEMRVESIQITDICLSQDWSFCETEEIPPLSLGYGEFQYL